MLPAAANSTFPTAWLSLLAAQELRVSLYCFVITLDYQKQKTKTFPELKTMGGDMCNLSYLCLSSVRWLWWTGTITFHSHTSVYCHYIPLHFFMLPPTPFYLRQLSTAAADEGHEQTNISAAHTSLPEKKKIACGLTCHFNLQHLYYLGPKSGSNQWGRMWLFERLLAS